jgi:single-stranded-DNA-specific exonuclease
MGYSEFHDNVNSICEKIKNLVDDRKDILIVSSTSSDGIISASLLIRAIWKLGGKGTARFLNTFDAEIYADLKKEDHDFYFFSDNSSGLSELFNKLFLKNWIILDHKKISPNEIAIDDNNAILNPWKYDIDGDKEITSGGISYLLAKNIDKSFSDLSPLAIVSALGEYQDVGDKRSLIGLNNEILEDSKKRGLIQTDIDLLLSFNEFLPIHESIANTYVPYLYGLTSNSDKCLDLLKKTNITLKKDGRLKTICDINQEEKFLILETIKSHLSSQIDSNINNLENILIGYTYILPAEEHGSHLYDGRRFSELLNSCALSNKTGLGIGICLGDRSSLLEEAEKDAQEFNNSSQKLISKILKEKWRIFDKGSCIFINADGIVEPEYVGYLSKLLGSYYQFMNKVIIMKTVIDENYSKYFFSSLLKGTIDVPQLTKELSNSVNGITMTFNNAEGQIVIPPAQEDSLISTIQNQIKKFSK